MNHTNLDIISLGETMIELYGTGSLSQSDSFNKSYAGDTMNIINMASKLGAKCGYITKLGDDPFKDYLENQWKLNNIDLTCTKIVDGFNAVHFTVLQNDNNRQFVYYRKGSAASKIDESMINDEYLASSKIFHTSSLTQCISETSRIAVEKFLKKSKDLNRITSFDTNFRSNIWSAKNAKSAIDDIIKYVDILAPSFPEEVNDVFELDSPTEMIKYGLEKGCKIVVVKCGESGAYIGTSNKIIKSNSYTPKGLIDTTGAGDAFMGGFLYSYLNPKHDLDLNLKYAIISAGLKVSARGGIESQPSKNDVEKYLHLPEIIII
ncbi:MAG: sugar kinase [Dehalococcoidia bacterium]